MKTVDYLDNPKLHDRVIQKIRKYFEANISWDLEYIYPIARVGHDAEGNTYPQIYKGDGTEEHYDIRPDWSVKSYCFFELNDPVTIINEDERTDYRFSVIFYARLDKLYPDKNYDYTAELIAEVILHLKTLQAYEIEYYTNPEEIFTRYSELEQAATQMLMKNGTAFKISFSIKDFEDCYEEVY